MKCFVSKGRGTQSVPWSVFNFGRVQVSLASFVHPISCMRQKAKNFVMCGLTIAWFEDICCCFLVVAV